MKIKTGILSQYRGLRKEIYVLFFGRVVTNLGSMIWPMLTLILSQKMGMDASKIAIYMTVFSIAMLPANLLGGRLADRYNKKNIIVICDLVSVVSYILCGILPLGYVSVALMAVASLFQNVEFPSYNALFADLTTTKDRERAYSLDYLGMNLGMVLSPTIAGILFKDYLWLSFLISGFAIGCSTMLIFFLVRDITPEVNDGEESVYQKSREKESLFQILRDNRLIVLYLVVTTLYYSGYGQNYYLLPLEMGRVHGEDGAVIYGTVSSLNCIVVVLFTPLITKLFPRLTELKKLFTGQLLVTAGFLVFLLLLGHIPVYYAAMVLFTWGEIFATIADGPYISNRMPASHRGRINGFASVLGTLLSGACDLSVGQLYDKVNSVAAWGFVFGLLGISLVLTLVLLSRDKRVYPKLYAAPSTDISE